MDKLKKVLDAFKAVAKSTGNELLLLLMGFISNIIILAYGSANLTIKKLVRIIMFAVKEYETELREWVNKTPNEYDDKLVDELLEALEDILGK
jgi:hypothetical protein